MENLTRPSMTDELNRLNSFQHWPYQNRITPLQISQAGFFYLQTGDAIQCVFCDGVLKHWKRDNHPYMQHITDFPLCPFIKSDISNVPLEGDVCGSSMTPTILLQRSHRVDKERYDKGIQLSRVPFNPSMFNKETRMKTFLSWSSQYPVTPDSLVDAGFYYTGENDQVVCFCCHGGLCQWTQNDNPWVEHARWYPQCSLVLLHKGSMFVYSMLLVCQPSEETTVDQTLTRDRTMKTLMQSSLVQSFLAKNVYPTSFIQLALLLHLETTGKAVKHLDELCEAVHRVKVHPLCNQLRFVKSEDVPVIQEPIICTLCLNREVSVVFLPCGHRICFFCRPSLNTCPICSTVIKGTVRMYLI